MAEPTYWDGESESQRGVWHRLDLGVTPEYTSLSPFPLCPFLSPLAPVTRTRVYLSSLPFPR